MPCKLWSSWVIPSSLYLEPPLSWNLSIVDMSLVTPFLLGFMRSALSMFVWWQNACRPCHNLQLQAQRLTWATVATGDRAATHSWGPWVMTSHAEVPFAVGTPEVNASSPGCAWSLLSFMSLGGLQALWGAKGPSGGGMALQGRGVCVVGTLRPLEGQEERKWGHEKGALQPSPRHTKWRAVSWGEPRPGSLRQSGENSPLWLAVFPQRAGQGTQATNGKRGALHTSPRGAVKWPPCCSPQLPWWP